MVRAGLVNAHALSIAPSNTVAGLVRRRVARARFCSARREPPVSITGAHGTARAIAIVGVMLAFVGIIQQPLFNGRSTASGRR